MNDRRVVEALLGASVAMVIVPAIALSGRVSLTDGAALGALGGAGVAVSAVVAVAARRVDDLVGFVTAAPVAALCVLVPLAYLPYMVLATAPESPQAGAAVVGLLAVLPGIGVPVSGAVVRSRRVRERATESVVVTVGGDDERDGGDWSDWRVVGVVAVAGVALVALGALTAVTGDVGFGSTVSTLSGLSTSLLLFAGDDETEVAVTDAGVRIDRSVVPWADLDGYRVTDEAVALVRSQWYLPDREFDREAVDDETALRDGLRQHLPRLDGDGRVELTSRR